MLGPGAGQSPGCGPRGRLEQPAVWQAQRADQSLRPHGAGGQKQEKQLGMCGTQEPPSNSQVLTLMTALSPREEPGGLGGFPEQELRTEATPRQAGRPGLRLQKVTRGSGPAEQVSLDSGGGCSLLSNSRLCVKLVQDIKVESAGGAHLPLFGVEKRAVPHKQPSTSPVSSKGIYPKSCPESSSPVPLRKCQQGPLPGLGNRSHLSLHTHQRQG